MNPKQLRDLIKLICEQMHLNAESAATLLEMTVAQESSCGTYLRQLGGGPALGIMQMEPATHNWLINDWGVRGSHRKQFRDRAMRYLSPNFPAEPQLVWNLAYSIATARLRYIADPQPLPKLLDPGKKESWLQDLDAYYKRVYNTNSGAAKPGDALASWYKYFEERPISNLKKLKITPLVRPHQTISRA